MHFSSTHIYISFPPYFIFFPSTVQTALSIMKLNHLRRRSNRGTMPRQGLADHCAGSDNGSEDIKFYGDVLGNENFRCVLF